MLARRPDGGPQEIDARSRRRFGRQRRTDEDLVQLAIDLADVIATLPESWQTLLELRKTKTMSEVANEMGVPRTTLNDRIRRIRQRFENAAMRDYLK